MIYTFRFISDEEDSFILDVNINHHQTFEELHNKIQEALDYDPSQMASFFSSNEKWEKLQEVAQMDMGSESGALMMNDTKIGDVFSEKQNILYIFDFFNERLLFGSIIRLIEKESSVTLPSVSKFEGTIPLQIAEPIPMENMDLIADPDLSMNEELLDDIEGYDVEES